MLYLKEIRDWVASLGIAHDDNVYIGKLDNKKQKSIGVYHRKSTYMPRTALGGCEQSTYDIKPVSLLIHWNKSQRETEKAAFALFEKIKSVTSLTLKDTFVRFIRLMVPEPQDVGTDDEGVYEYVIWLDFIYRKG